MRSANPYLNFPGTAEEAFSFYQSIFGGEVVTFRFRDMPGEMGDMLSEDDQNKVAHCALRVGDSVLMASDVLEVFGQSTTPGDNVFVCLDPDDADEAKRAYDALAEGAQEIIMKLEQQDWAELHGQVRDRFGVLWMIDYAGNKANPSA